MIAVLLNVYTKIRQRTHSLRVSIQDGLEQAVERGLDAFLDAKICTALTNRFVSDVTKLPRLFPFHYMINQKIQRAQLRRRLVELGVVNPLTVSAWWPRGRSDNFGDLLTHYILAHVAGIDCIYDRNKSFMSVGSVVRLARDGTKVWGSGIIRSSEVIAAKPQCLAVRGPLTRERLVACSIDCPDIFGDPAMLLPYIKKKKSTDLAKNVLVIPHFKHRFLFHPSTNYQFLDVRVRNIQEIERFIDEINSSSRVVTSSLHAFIVCVAYGIPVSLFAIPNHSIHGDDVKFLDFCLGVGADAPRFNVLKNIKDPEKSLCKMTQNCVLVEHNWNPQPLLGSLYEEFPTSRLYQFMQDIQKSKLPNSI